MNTQPNQNPAPAWTPGPWKVMHLYRDPPAIYDAAENTLIATCEEWKNDHGEMAANAALMACAPELAQSLRAMLREFDYRQPTSTERAVLSEARALLARINGNT